MHFALKAPQLEALSLGILRNLAAQCNVTVEDWESSKQLKDALLAGHPDGLPVMMANRLTTTDSSEPDTDFTLTFALLATPTSHRSSPRPVPQPIPAATGLHTPSLTPPVGPVASHPGMNDQRTQKMLSATLEAYSTPVTRFKTVPLNSTQFPLPTPPPTLSRHIPAPRNGVSGMDIYHKRALLDKLEEAVLDTRRNFTMLASKLHAKESLRGRIGTLLQTKQDDAVMQAWNGRTTGKRKRDEDEGDDADEPKRAKRRVCIDVPYHPDEDNKSPSNQLPRPLLDPEMYVCTQEDIDSEDDERVEDMLSGDRRANDPRWLALSSYFRGNSLDYSLTKEVEDMSWQCPRF